MAFTDPQTVTIKRLLGRRWDDTDIDPYLAAVGANAAAQAEAESLLTRISAAESSSDKAGTYGHLERVEDVHFRGTSRLVDESLASLVTQLAHLIGVEATGLARAACNIGHIWRA